MDSLGESPLSASIPHHYFVDDIEAYPNPVSDYLTIDIPGFVYQDDMRLRIISINGQAVVSRKAQPGKEQISVAGWQRGLYLVEVVRNNGAVYSKKIVVR
ncbi:MAG: T9SS type A sorting domain-containing protein [Bacteroidales bacterium]|nr:T9SS type A sorting domain-containing protein [Bacteroidales bacterium]